jgi:micrococcal nuclease
MKKKLLYIIGGIFALFIIIGVIAPTPEPSAVKDIKQNAPAIATSESVPNTETKIPNTTTTVVTVTTPQVPNIIDIKTPPTTQYVYYPVSSVVDGDTVKININGKIETFRLIGIDTPETVDPRKDVQCFGVEASNKAKELLNGKKVRIETDPSQGTYDKYNRSLGYIYLESGLFYNKYMVEQGYAHEYTYGTPYKYQTEFKTAQTSAQTNKLGFWATNTCNGNTTTTATVVVPETAPTGGATGACTIKGNISSIKEKVYHVVGCGSYTKTVIDESKGERWFCTEQEAISAGWRKALNCI